MFRKKETVLPDNADALLRMAAETQDPALQKRCLDRADALRPDDLAVNRALLMLGDRWRVKERPGDVTLIKCAVLLPLEHPERFDEKTQEAMTRAVFHHPQLAKCLSLTHDPAGFTAAYLTELCGEYLRLFVEGARENQPGLFGFSLPGAARRAWGAPCARVLAGIFASPFLTETEQKTLAGRFYRAAAARYGDTAEMDRLLGDLKGLIE